MGGIAQRLGQRVEIGLFHPAGRGQPLAQRSDRAGEELRIAVARSGRVLAERPRADVDESELGEPLRKARAQVRSQPTCAALPRNASTKRSKRSRSPNAIG